MKKLYRIILRTNFKKEIKLEEKFAQVKKAAADFSEQCDFEKDIKIIEIEDCSIILLASLLKPIESPKIFMSSLTPLLKEICKSVGTVYDGRRKFFRLESFEALNVNQYTEYIKHITLKEMESDSEKKHCENIFFDDKNAEDINNDEVNIPERKFPYLPQGPQRTEIMQQEEYESISSYKNVLKKLDSLIGMDNVKAQIKDLSSFIIKNNKRYSELNIDNPGLFYNVLISGNEGCGKSTIGRLVAELYYSLGVIGKGKIFSIDYNKDIYPGYSLERTVGNVQSGAVIINCSIEHKRAGNNLSVLKQTIKNYKKNFVFLIIVDNINADEFIINAELKSSINFQINIPDYNDIEMLKLVKYFGNHEGYDISEVAEEYILKAIKYYKEKGEFKNIYTAERIIDKAVVKRLLNGSDNILIEKDFYFIETETKKNEGSNQKESEPIEELESLIGLTEVKKKVKEIASFAAVQEKRRKMGLDQDKICLHMCFSGEPGTCKTTVARCIGKILNKLNILSKGHFIEAAREDLCGKYIGYTASMTADKINEAKGGVLFIDEAYSLVSSSDKDYGHEAINTLVKKMEDMRGDLVVIFAGYSKEIEELLKMNPGLRSRIAFHIEFKNYSPMELFDIWKKFYKDNNYEITEEASEEMKKLCFRAYNLSWQGFSNGRTIRNYFERTKMAQAVRILQQNLITVQDIMTITYEDIKSLSSELETEKVVKVESNKHKIGFVG